MSYVEVTRNRFEAEMDDMGFKHITLPGTVEMVFERDIPNSDFSVRVYSSIDPRTGVSRKVGADAVRVLLFNKAKERGAKVEKRVNRTGSEDGVMARTRSRAREVWGWYTQNKCSCGGVMVTRKGPKGNFLGCSNYPDCKNTSLIS